MQTEQKRVEGMILHCGATIATRQEVRETRTPDATATWFPIPHGRVVDEVSEQLENAGFRINNTNHSLSHGGMRYFGAMEVGFGDVIEQKDHHWVVGVRNSHDKKYPAGLVAGTRVLVCDNLSFSGEVRIDRKHTRHVLRDLRALTARAVGRLGDKFIAMDRRVDCYKNRNLLDREVNDILIQALDAQATSASKIPAILKQWREPEHAEFEDKNLWSLFNAFTETYKGYDPNLVMQRSQALHGLCDGYSGVVLEA